MRIVTSIGGRWKGCEDSKILFAIHKERARKLFSSLPRLYGVRPPDELTLRPFYFKGQESRINGRALYINGRGYFILLSVPDCMAMPDKGLWVMDHEVAHIIAWRMGDNSRMRHRPIFEDVYRSAREVPIS